MSDVGKVEYAPDYKSDAPSALDLRGRFSKQRPAACPNVLLNQLRELAVRQHHYEAEDCWYSCPKSDEGSCNPNAGTGCNCGADEQNEKIEVIYQQLRQA